MFSCSLRSAVYFVNRFSVFMQTMSYKRDLTPTPLNPPFPSPKAFGEGKGGRGDRVRTQCIIIQFKKMPVGWFLAGIPQHWFIRFCRPIVEFVLIAPNTAIKQIIKAIITSLALWPKMVNRQLTTCICFTIFVFLTIDCQKNKILIPQNSQAKFAR
jgi:hypothetical protein